MKNVFISNLHKKDVDHFTSDIGLYLRKKGNKPFKKLCNIFTNANIICENNFEALSDDEYFNQLSEEYIPLEHYDLNVAKNNIVLERYPQLDKDEPYIFVCNHTCPEDIETVLNVLDRNAYLVLGSIESLKYNPEMYLCWVNGMIPFDIIDNEQRKLVMQKMLRVLKSNSILIFPEGSHNYNPNNLINNLFDGPVNLALQTNRKIVVVTLVRDNENNVSYIDVGNPIDIKNIAVDMNRKFSSEEEIEKYYVKNLSSFLRNKMATAVYHIIARHFRCLKRADYLDIESYIRSQKIEEAFKKLKWKRDVFDAEYLVKKTAEEKEYEEVVSSLSDVALNTSLDEENIGWLLKELDIYDKDVAKQMRKYWLSTKDNNVKHQKLIRKK